MAKRLRSNASQALHFSFGHDVLLLFYRLIQVTLLPVLSALGVFPSSAYIPLGTNAIEWYRTFRGGNHVPFCGNIVVEKVHCPNGYYVRILNNQIPGSLFAALLI